MDSDRVDSPNSSSYGCTDPHPNATDHIQRRLIITLAICTAFMAVEAIGGYLSGSLAIISDAAHLLSGIPSIQLKTIAHILIRHCRVFGELVHNGAGKAATFEEIHLRPAPGGDCWSAPVDKHSLAGHWVAHF